MRRPTLLYASLALALVVAGCTRADAPRSSDSADPDADEATPAQAMELTGTQRSEGDDDVRVEIQRPPGDPALSGWSLSTDTLHLTYHVRLYLATPVRQRFVIVDSTVIVGFDDALRDAGWRVIRGGEPAKVPMSADWAWFLGDERRERQDRAVRGALSEAEREADQEREYRLAAGFEPVRLRLEYEVVPEVYPINNEMGITSLFIPGEGKRITFVVPEMYRAYLEQKTPAGAPIGWSLPPAESRVLRLSLLSLSSSADG